MAQFAVLMLAMQQGLLAMRVLPEAELIWLALPFALAALGYPHLRWLGAGVLAILVQWSLATDQNRPVELFSAANHPARVVAEVVSLVDRGEYYVAYDVSIVSTDDLNLVGHRLRLYQTIGSDCEYPEPGSEIHGLILIEPIRGVANLESGLSSDVSILKGVTGSGKVVQIKRISPESRRWLPLLLRDRISAWLDLHARSDLRSIIGAITIGSSGSQPGELFQWIERTGTQHLLVISGLHLSFVGWGVFKGLRWLGCGLRLASMLGCFVAMLYFLISGQALSVQRATLMFLLLAVAQIASLNLGRFTSFWFALSMSLLVTPWASGYAGFWYSFLAVAVLLLLSQRSLASAPSSLLAVLLSIRTQCVLLTALVPVSSQFMNTVSFVAPLANLIAIPIMTGLVLPPALLAVATFLLSLAFDSWMLEAMAILSRWVAEWGLRLLVQVLFFFAELNGAAQLAKLPLAYGVLLGFTILVFVSGIRLVDSGLVLIALLPLLQPKISRPAIGEVKIWVMDVGQGTSVLIQTASENLLYDTGPLTRTGFNAGERIVAPELQAVGAHTVHRLIVSHNDTDHAGGLAVLRKRLDVKSVITPQTGHCREYQSWTVDSVDFQLFAWRGAQNSNNRSCLLQISTGSFRLLFAGDIESEAELVLMEELLPKVDWLLVPHHGAKTSSSPAFLNHVRPQWAIVSAGYANGYGHPHPRIVERYRKRGASLVSTAEVGALTFHANENGVRLLETARAAHEYHWNKTR